MIEVHLYGDLRRHAQEKTPSSQSVVQLPIENYETVGRVLREIGIDPAEAGHIFLNHQLLNTRCSMGFWLGYQSAEGRIPAGGSYLDAPLRSGDRLGVFPTRMAMLIV
ncbi:MAG: MoaD/ThiS family protein [Chloroflexi bacterium]|nr:MoaD/ThiS family protein [Chloroflexota bacterium]